MVSVNGKEGENADLSLAREHLSKATARGSRQVIPRRSEVLVERIHLLETIVKDQNRKAG